MSMKSKRLKLDCTEKERHWLNINCSDMVINTMELNTTQPSDERKFTKLRFNYLLFVFLLKTFSITEQFASSYLLRVFNG